MKANKLVLAAVLASAGVASIATLAEDNSAMHKMMPAMEPAKAATLKASCLPSQARPDGSIRSR